MENVDVLKIFNRRYQQMQKIFKYAYDIVLFTINMYFTCFEALNLEQTLIVQ